jgi:hypothetical protein
MRLGQKEFVRRLGQRPAPTYHGPVTRIDRLQSVNIVIVILFHEITGHSRLCSLF